MSIFAYNLIYMLFVIIEGSRDIAPCFSVSASLVLKALSCALTRSPHIDKWQSQKCQPRTTLHNQHTEPLLSVTLACQKDSCR